MNRNYFKASTKETDLVEQFETFEFFDNDGGRSAERAYKSIVRAANSAGLPDGRISVYRAAPGVPACIPAIMPDLEVRDADV